MRTNFAARFFFLSNFHTNQIVNFVEVFDATNNREKKVISYRATLRTVYGESVARYCGSSGVQLIHLSIERRIFLEITRIQVHAAVASLNGQKFCYRNFSAFQPEIRTHATHIHRDRIRQSEIIVASSDAVVSPNFFLHFFSLFSLHSRRS